MLLPFFINYLQFRKSEIEYQTDICGSMCQGKIKLNKLRYMVFMKVDYSRSNLLELFHTFWFKTYSVCVYSSHSSHENERYKFKLLTGNLGFIIKEKK